MTTVGSPILSFIVLLMMNGPAVAQSCPLLQVRNPAGNYIVPGVMGDIPYSGDLALDAYVQQPTEPAAQKLPFRPSIVVIHGGGWSSGSCIAHVGQILVVVAHAGYSGFC